jgi:hypothetical protein
LMNMREAMNVPRLETFTSFTQTSFIEASQNGSEQRPYYLLLEPQEGVNVYVYGSFERYTPKHHPNGLRNWIFTHVGHG